jgi:hypothetical protein
MQGQAILSKKNDDFFNEVKDLGYGINALFKENT